MHRPPRPARWTRSDYPPRLGVVMIVKNEAERLPALLGDIAELADEVVVVDTGSTDDTTAILDAWGVRWEHQAWRNDFSHARNRSLELARAPFVLWLDGDDRLPAESVRVLCELRDRGLPLRPDTAYSLTVHNLDAAGRAASSFRQVRVLPRREGVRYEGSVHESPMASLAALGVTVEALPADVHHTGYATPEMNRAKAARNAPLLRAEVQWRPHDLQAVVHLARAEAALGDAAEAERVLGPVLALARASGKQPRVLAELHLLRAGYREELGNEAGAADDLRDAHALWPEWAVPVVRLARRHAAAGRWAEVAALLGAGPELSFEAGALGGVAVARLRSDALRLRGELLAERGETAAALGLLREALDADPRHGEARLALGQLLLRREEFAAARATLEPLGDDAGVMHRVLDVCTALGLARAGTGAADAAAACLAPLVDLLAEILPDPHSASPADLAAALESAGFPAAARNMHRLEALAVASGW